MPRNVWISHTICLLWSSLLIPNLTAQEIQNPERTVFQTGQGWQPVLDLRSDVAIVYGVNGSFTQRVQSWRDRGYGAHMMTGSAWGEYQDYLDGLFDGNKHWDEAQVDREGRPIMHGANVPYMVPTRSFTEYLKSLVKTAIDAGVTAIHLEEPEFWNRGGYSKGFQKEWQDYYGEPWQAQHTSAEATYRSAKLKYHLYFQTVKDVFQYAKTYSASKGRNVRCFVPTHSMINYSSWGIISPESSLTQIDELDGYIAQVWTGTARTPNLYRGREKERTFETAFLEYGQMVSMTAPGRLSATRSEARRVYFLTDPVEDRPDYTWDDYRKNYRATYIAQLMWPQTFYYEVMPWPSRIFKGRFGTEDGKKKEIPSAYATEVQILINALNNMNQAETVWDCGARGIGVLVSDTMMFQRFMAHGEEWEDPHHSNLFGLAMPLLKHGIPVQPIQMERIAEPSALSGQAVLLLSYTHMKPPWPELHEALATWVKQGGCLAFYGSDRDPYQSVREWWNQEMDYRTPSQHLFECLGLGRDPKEGFHSVQDGEIYISRRDPMKLAADKYGARNVRRSVRNLLERKRLDGLWNTQNYLHLRRGPYHIVSTLDESLSPEPRTVEGTLIDLFDPALPVMRRKSVQPGETGFLYDLEYAPKQLPAVLASACQIEELEREKGRCLFQAKGAAGTHAVARILMKREPSRIELKFPPGATAEEYSSAWDTGSSTLLVDFGNHPDGVAIELTWD